MGFDLERLEVTTEPVTVLENVNMKVETSANFDFSQEGSLIYVPGGPERIAGRALVWVDRQGQTERLPVPPGRYRQLSLSPDGERLAFSMTEEIGSQIWVLNIADATLAKRTFIGSNSSPVWTPDGRRLAFSSGIGGQRVMWMAGDGSDEPEPLLTMEVIRACNPSANSTASWSHWAHATGLTCPLQTSPSPKR